MIAGKVYTPAPLAREVVRRTLRPLRGRAGVRVLDPACGDGVFLKEARAILPARALVGMDVDAAAVARARRDLPGVELHVGDALRHDWRERFDAVIGNPPWVSYSGRHAQPLRAEDRRHFTERFTTFRLWPNLHGLFLEQAVRLSRGRVGMLLPAQLLDLAGYGPVRAFVREHCTVTALLDCGEERFPGVTQPCCALFLEAGGSRGGAAPFRVVDPADAELLAWLDTLPKPPPAMFGDIGVHTGNCARKLLGVDGVPIREGKDVHAFRLDAPRKSLLAGLPRGEGEYFRIGALERYKAVPILLRQTATRPIAALHTEPTYFRNSVIACHGLPGVPHARVVAWLNSEIVARYHRARVREASQRAFPQVKLKHLRDLPLPEWTEDGLRAFSPRRARPDSAARETARRPPAGGS